ncbi:hypothetical protein GJV44_00855 [Candidatus Vallotia cooleyia]|nr:hypothetical protein GJV44_00855 [Candidatus Vallotia cooleyia]
MQILAPLSTLDISAIESIDDLLTRVDPGHSRSASLYGNPVLFNLAYKLMHLPS